MGEGIQRLGALEEIFGRDRLTEALRGKVREMITRKNLWWSISLNGSFRSLRVTSVVEKDFDAREPFSIPFRGHWR
jgi:hypothetical protein